MAKEQKVEGVGKSVVAKKATVTTETILGKSALKLEAGLKALAEAQGELENLGNVSNDLTLKIANQEQQLEELKGKFEEELRSGKVDLQNALKEDAKSLVVKVLAENGAEAINKEELAQLRKDYSDLKSNFDKQKASEVAAALGAKQKEFEAAKALYEAQAKASEAQTLAQVKTLEDKVNFLTEQNASLLEQLDSAGERAVKIAQASSVGTINVGAEGKR